MARDVTSDGDRITALASAGTLYLSSNQNVTLTRWGCGSILSILPTGTPRMTHVVTGEDAVAVGEVGGDVRAADAARQPHHRDDAADQSTTTRAMATPILALRDASLSTAFSGWRRRSADGPGPFSTGGWLAVPARVPAARRARPRRDGLSCPGPAARAVPAAARRAAARAAAPGTGSSRAGQRHAGHTARMVARVAGDGIGQRQRGSPPWPVRGYGIGSGGVPGCPVCGSVRCDGSSTLGSRPRSENAASMNG